MGMIVDMNMSAIYRIDETWGLRVGYNLMWLTGVAALISGIFRGVAAVVPTALGCSAQATFS